MSPRTLAAGPMAIRQAGSRPSPPGARRATQSACCIRSAGECARRATCRWWMIQTKSRPACCQVAEFAVIFRDRRHAEFPQRRLSLHFVDRRIRIGAVPGSPPEIFEWGLTHYNTVHAYKALEYRSPREFRSMLVGCATASQRSVRGALGSRPPALTRAWQRTTRNHHARSGLLGGQLQSVAPAARCMAAARAASEEPAPRACGTECRRPRSPHHAPARWMRCGP